MDKKLIGWVVVVPNEHGDIRTFYRADQSTWMEDEVLSRTRSGTPFRVEPEFGTPRKVLYVF